MAWKDCWERHYSTWDGSSPHPRGSPGVWPAAAAGGGDPSGDANPGKTPGTDHCPGYGSGTRFVALATMGAGRDAESMGGASPVTILEVMGRNAGWLAVASALGKREERDAPI